MVRGILAVVAACGLAAGVLVYRDRVRDERVAENAAALRALSDTRLAPAGSAPQAGISARTVVDVEPFPARLARQLDDDPDFHRLHHRCGVCHETPDPALHSAAGWDSVVVRMRANIRDAGLVPLGSDEEAVLRVLRRFAADSAK
jgi:hypothetical protein